MKCASESLKIRSVLTKVSEKYEIFSSVQP